MRELGIADTFASLVWTVRHSAAGGFELKAPMTENNIRLLRKQRYIYRPDVKEAVFIKSVIEQYDESGDVLIVSGDSTDGLLDKRCTDSYDGTFIASLKSKAAENGRQYGFRKMHIDIASEDDFDVIMATGAGWFRNLGELAREQLGLADKRLYVDFDAENRKLYCRVRPVADRSAEQTANTHIIFDIEDGNLTSQRYEYSEVGCYNRVEGTALIPYGAKIYEGKEEYLHYTVGDAEANGLGLTVLALKIEAPTDSLAVPDGNGGFLTDESGQYRTGEYVNYPLCRAQLKAACEEAYAPFSESFECEAVGDGYRSEWQVGDYVTVNDSKRKQAYRVQIAEVREVFENGTKTVSVTLGEPLRSVIDLDFEFRLSCLELGIN
ncbi:MAG: siphovirus ReqiPepy6 Gp37-like family protein [Prevotella sp.]|nr:siphovirus ReqiPepy6 Gp37-like family protein [Prevotella sp.]